jgi:protease I
MEQKNDQIRVAVLCSDGVEMFELSEPVEALKEAGADVAIVSPQAMSIQTCHGTHSGETVDVDLNLDDVTTHDFDALLLPGGAINVDRLRADPSVIRFIQKFAAEKKPVGAICHGAVILADAGLVRDRKISASSSLRNDLIQAGAKWADEDIAIDESSGGLITSRCHEDLYEFNQLLVEFFHVANHARRKRAPFEMRTREGGFTPGALLD